MENIIPISIGVYFIIIILVKLRLFFGRINYINSTYHFVIFIILAVIFNDFIDVSKTWIVVITILVVLLVISIYRYIKKIKI